MLHTQKRRKIVSFFKAHNIEELLIANHSWWNRDGALARYNPFSAYNRNEIIKENDYNSDLIIKLNKYMISTDSQCGKCETKFSMYHALALPQRSEALDMSINALKKCKVKEMQREYLCGWMIDEDANKLIKYLDKMEASGKDVDFIYTIFKSNNKVKSNRDSHYSRISLTTEIIKLADGKQSTYSPTNYQTVSRRFEYVTYEIQELKYQIPRLCDQLGKLVYVEFCMKEFCEKGLIEKLLAVFSL